MEYKKFLFEDIVLVFGIEGASTVFTIVPLGKEKEINDEKMRGVDPLGRLHFEPAMQASLDSDGYSRDFSAGRTHRNRTLSMSFGIPEFKYDVSESKIVLVAEYKTGFGLLTKQYFEMVCGSGAISTYCIILNNSAKSVTMENIPTFNITRLTPFERYNQRSDVVVHRMRNNWSGEGVLESRRLCELSLEDSWGGVGCRMEKFGQLGSMPSNGWLPYVAVQDRKNNCTWAVQLEAPGSWQIEVANVWGGLTICGGLADFTYGHWNKLLTSNQSFTTHKAYITVCEGGLEIANNRLIKGLNFGECVRGIEDTLPIGYNEYCYTWGQPTQEKIDSLVGFCKDLGVDYFVMDAGWYREEGKSWEALGDWNVNKEYFPNGLKGYVESCKRNGLIAGVWFEFESISEDSDVAKEHPDWLLTYKKRIINHGGRCMLDFRKEEVFEYLRDKVINQLVESGIKYLKVDYNESIGLGVDGAESLGEGLRQHMEGVLRFYNELITNIPDLVVEMCSSGGMRHEPKFLSLGSICSFSDAHECSEGAIIACNLHRIIHPKKMLIWATIRDDYNEDDVYFTLVKSMLGRICLSGNLASKPAHILNIIKEGLAFYQKVKSVISNGETVEICSEGTDYLSDIHGWQYLKRVTEDKILLYFFAIGSPNIAKTFSGFKNCKIESVFGNAKVEQKGDDVLFVGGSHYVSASIVLLEKEDEIK